MSIRKYLSLPSPIELGISKYNALPSSLFSNRFSDDPVEYTWEDYYEEMKVKYPFRYWLNQTLPEFFRNIKYKFKFINDAWYWLKCHIVPAHRYHMLDIREQNNSLHPYRFGYTDPVNKILLANFAILVEFVEKEQPYNLRSDYSEDQINNDAGLKIQQANYDECMALYRWWKFDMENHKNEVSDKLYSLSSYKSRVEYDKAHKTWMEMNDKYDDEEDQMLIRLMNIRRSLWT